MSDADTQTAPPESARPGSPRFRSGLHPVESPDLASETASPWPVQGRIRTHRARLGQAATRSPSSQAGAYLDRRGYFMRRWLAIVDCLAVAAAVAILEVFQSLVIFSASPQNPVTFVPIAIALWLILAGLSGMYHLDEKRLELSVADEIGSVVQIAAVWTWLMFLLETLMTKAFVFATPGVLLWVASVPLILTFRAAARNAARRRSWHEQLAFVVGRPADAERVTRVFERHPEFGVRVIRELTLEPGDGVERLGSLIGFAEHSNIDRVIFAGNYEGLDDRTGALRLLSDEGIKVDLVPGDSEVFRSDAELHFVEGLPLLTLPTTNKPRTATTIKRILDVTLSALGLFVMAPLFAYVAIRIKHDSPGPVFFRQRRIGEDGEPFELMKFRTMVDDADTRKHEVEELNRRTDGLFKIADDPRITKYGARLRRRSFDELPQLINVLRGEMSLVGPRPLIERESDLVRDHYLARFDVRPGITGPWQAFGRSDIPFDDMLKLDYRYVTNWSVGEDLRLLVRTVSVIAHGRGAY